MSCKGGSFEENQWWKVGMVLCFVELILTALAMKIKHFGFGFSWHPNLILISEDGPMSFVLCGYLKWDLKASNIWSQSRSSTKSLPPVTNSLALSAKEKMQELVSSAWKEIAMLLSISCVHKRYTFKSYLSIIISKRNVYFLLSLKNKSCSKSYIIKCNIELITHLCLFKYIMK